MNQNDPESEARECLAKEAAKVTVSESLPEPIRHSVIEVVVIKAMLTFAEQRVNAALDEAVRARDEAVQALADYRGQQYAPWSNPEPEDTLGDMIDNQAWVMMSHIGSIIGHRDGDPDLMERWQDDWAERYPDLLKGWFSPHRAAAAYIAERLTIRTPTPEQPQ